MRLVAIMLAVPTLLGAACAVERTQSALAPTGLSCLRGRICTLDGPVVGAEIVIKGQGLPETRRAISGIDGEYSICDIPSGGPYTVSVAAVGFSPQSRVGILLVPGATHTLPFRMDIGEGDLVLADPSPVIDLRSTTGGAVMQINSRTGEPEPHPR